MAVSLHNMLIFDVQNGELSPQGASNQTATGKRNTDNWDLISIMFFATTGSAHNVAREFEGQKHNIVRQTSCRVRDFGLEDI